VRCGCSLSPAIGGPWTPFIEFAWNNASGTPPSAEGLFSEVLLDFQAFPNPSVGEVSLSLNTDVEETFLLQLYDLPGRLVYSDRILAVAGPNLFSMDLSHLGEAVYLLRVTGADGSVQTTRIVITK
jgi:hypothetical protein